MRIALRPGGGRGDYELTGTYNNLKAVDLLEKNFFFQITPALTIDGRAVAKHLNGKYRIRPDYGWRHPYILISSVLLFPRPRRELIKTPDAPPQLQGMMYTIAGIDVDVVNEAMDSVVFAPRIVWARTCGGFLKIDYTNRMAIITALWGASIYNKTKIGSLIRTHRKSVLSGNHNSIINSAKAIQRYYQTQNDVLLFLLRDFDLPADPAVALADISDTNVSDETFASEEDLVSTSESLRQRAYRWRTQVDRGPGARKFSIQVRKAYDYRCFFSGERFPKLPVFDVAGVDAAHILPWATHRLNSVPNGLCLCKLCHWAFDNGLLRLDFNDSVNQYELSIPSDIEKVAVSADFDLSRFKSYLGLIDSTRLPANQNLWPSVDCIREFNSIRNQ